MDCSTFEFLAFLVDLDVLALLEIPDLLVHGLDVHDLGLLVFVL